VGDESLNDRLAAIGQMSAGIAHEIRNPLTTVKGFLQLLKKEYPHQYWDYIFPELDQAILTVQNLLQVSKPGLDTEPYVTVSLCAEVESLLYLFHNQIYQVHVETDYRDRDNQIFCKKSQIKKAIFNVLKNAFEAVESQGTITVQHFREGCFVCLVIADTGHGIPEEKIRLLGTPFFSTKDNGTGMGLTQAYTVFHNHGAQVDVKSVPGKGTNFMIKFPVETEEDYDIKEIGFEYVEGQTLKKFFIHNLARFNELLISDATETFELVRKSERFSKETLLDDARQLVESLLDGVVPEIVSMAKERGTIWAKSDLPVISKLTWFQSVRQVVWILVQSYYSNQEIDARTFFRLERKINSLIDTFIKHFFASFTNYRDTVIQSQRELIDELSVPVIPIADNVAVIPLIGTLDTYRAKKVQENILMEISNLKLQKLVIDLSGVAFMDSAVAKHLFRIADGIKLLGCQAVLSGIRPEIANTMIEQGISVDEQIEVHATLRQAIQARN
jgi:anti-anti-sigma factor